MSSQSPDSGHLAVVPCGSPLSSQGGCSNGDAARQVAVERWRIDQLSLVRQVSAQVADVLDLDELFQRVADLIWHTFGYYYVALFTVESNLEQLHFRASAGPAPVATDERRSTPLAVQVRIGEGIIGWVAQHGAEIVANDVSAETRYRHEDALPETRSEVALPLKIGERVLGVLDVQGEQLDAFDETDLLVLHALADNIAVAVEGARLYGDLRRRAEHLAAVAEISRAVTSVLDLDSLLQEVVARIRHRFGYSFVYLFTLREDTGQLVYRAGSGPQSEILQEQGLVYDLFSPQGIVPWVARHGETVLANDVSREPRYRPSPLPPINTGSELTVPLIFGGKVLGVLDVQSDRQDAFSSDDRFLFEALAANVAVAIRNAYLYESAQKQAWVSTVLLQVAESIQALTSLDQVLSTVVRLTPMLAGVGRCVLLMWDEDAEAFVPSAAYGLSPAQRAALDAVNLRPQELAAIARMRLTKSPVFMLQPATDTGLPGTFMERLGFSVLTMLPLLIRGEVVGAMLVDCGSPSPCKDSDSPLSSQGEGLPLSFPTGHTGAQGGCPRFSPGESGPAVRDLAGESSDERLSILRGIAYQTAVVLENARLLEERQGEAYVSAALLQVTQTVVRLGDLDEILSAIVRMAPLLVGIRRCLIFLWDDEKACFRLTQSYGVASETRRVLSGRRFAPGDFPLLDRIRECDDVTMCVLSTTLSGDDARDKACLIPQQLMGELSGHSPDSQEISLYALPLSVKTDVFGVMLVQESGTDSHTRGSPSPCAPLCPVGKDRGLSLFSPGGSRWLEIVTGIARQAALSIQNYRWRQEMAGRERMERELQVARTIQQTFLSREVPYLEGWELAVTWRSARQVGGDFYDIFDLPGRRLGLVVADVADKGIPAALFMALTRALVRAAALTHQSPAEALAQVNDMLIPDAQHGMFVTALYGVVALDTGQLVYANAGHLPPLVLRYDTRTLERPGKGGLALGIVEGARVPEQRIDLHPGDYLILYTDGVTDALSASGEFYGDQRLQDCIRSAARLCPLTPEGGTQTRGECTSAQSLLDVIDASLSAFVGETPAADDLTLTVLGRRPAIARR